MNRKSKVMVGSLGAVALMAGGLFFASCGGSHYDNYKDYQSGYEAAQNGRGAPAFWRNKSKKEGYESGLNDLRSGNKKPPLEFQYTKKELTALENRWDTFEDMMASAMKALNRYYQEAFQRIMAKEDS